MKDDKNLFPTDNTYYLFIPFIGPLVDPDKLSSIQISTPKSLRGKIIKRFIQMVESAEKFLETK